MFFSTVTIKKESGVLGFKLSGGYDGIPLMVSKILPGTPADKSGKIMASDEIILVRK